MNLKLPAVCCKNSRRYFLFLQILVLGLWTYCLPTVGSEPPRQSKGSTEAQQRVMNLIRADKGRIEEIFKDIHQNPELGFMEVRTAGIVAIELERLGFEVKTGIGKTGVLAILRNGSGPTVLYRADMDANAVDAGLYDGFGMPQPNFMVALHSAPIPLGTIVSAGGVLMAGTDQLDVTFYGVGGHGSAPQHSKDPVLMAATAVVQYQSIVSRHIDPQQAAVLTVGSIQAGEDNNV